MNANKTKFGLPLGNLNNINGKAAARNNDNFDLRNDAQRPDDLYINMPIENCEKDLN